MGDYIKDKSDEVRGRLIQLVGESDMKVGDQLPSEASLAATFGFSRNTVRETLVQMESEGIVTRNHGIGTFLREVPKDHGNYLSFPNIISEMGMKARVVLTEPRSHEVPGEVASDLKAKRPNDIKRVERVIYADDTPMIVVSDYLPQRLVEHIEDWSHFDGDMIALVGKLTAQNRFSQKVSVSALNCDARISEMLEVEQGAPLVQVHSVLQTMTLESVIVSDSIVLPNTIPLNYLGTIRVNCDD
ncbi:GntR family transcriptional regulator [Ruegeria hyattellae]|uniref:GntR family transcriptional regulator n=1 Tax=Ruegeria hyattellae TaxID=3233337 RepID=UPI00355AF2A1